MVRIIFLFFMISGTLYCRGQEVCDNAVDDDGDGLTDLNDPDCACNLVAEIPNGGFEDSLCCPSVPTQLSCADKWVQASGATSDYFHTCGYNGMLGTYAPSFPLPDNGAGYAGFGSDGSAEVEYIGVCLKCPLQAGADYEIQLYLAQPYAIAQTLDFHMFGTPNCSELPWTGQVNCPVGSGNWADVASATVNFPASTNWQIVSLTFTPTTDLYGIAFGYPCNYTVGLPAFPPTLTYFFIDAVSIVKGPACATVLIQEHGKWCDGDLKLSVSADTAGGTWQWYESGIALVGETTDSLDLMIYGAGNYTAVYTLPDGCISDSVTISIPLQPVAGFTFAPDTGTVGQSVSFVDTSLNAYQWDWFFGDGSGSPLTDPTHIYTDTGTYTIQLVTGNSGCFDTAYANIYIKPVPPSVPDTSVVEAFYVPNAFTPNGDQINDQFGPVFSEGYNPEYYRFTVFNRWGEKIFDMDSYRYNWTGNYQGNPAPDGVYIWQLKFNDPGKTNTRVFRGHVVLIR